VKDILVEEFSLIMAQIFGDVKEAWMRASYADYSVEGTY
jgi:hypothetical protein